MRLILTCLLMASVFVLRSQTVATPLETILLRFSPNSFQPTIDTIGNRIHQLPVDKALPVLDKLLHLSMKLPNSKVAFRQLNELGRIYYNEHFISQKYLLYGLSILDDQAFAAPEIQKIILGDIGTLYYNTEDLDNAEYYLKKTWH